MTSSKQCARRVNANFRSVGVKGKVFFVRFWVDENGAVTNVTVSPRVEQADYRDRWLRQLRDFVFNPATSADGTPIPGEFPMTVRLS